MRMLKDAQRGEFKVILCDDKDRFARFDSITQGYYVKRLRDAGVRLETVAQGVVDWGSFAGRITAAILDEAKKIESQANSRRVITRMLLMARQGKWLGGKPPCAYDLTPDPELGKRLVPGDPAQVRAVQLMFRLYGEKGLSLDEIVRELHGRGILDPKGNATWNKTTVRAVLRNRKYVGDTVWNAGHDGKYSEFTNGQVLTSDQKTPKKTNPAADWVVRLDTHEPLIDRDIFEKVRRRLEENRAKSRPGPTGKRFALSGLLVCAKCGFRMIGGTWGEKRYYKCGRYHHEGKYACAANIIQERKVLPCVVAKLQEVVLNPANLEQLREEVRRQERERQTGQPRKLALLRKRIDELARKVEQGVERMALIDRELLTEYGFPPMHEAGADAPAVAVRGGSLSGATAVCLYVQFTPMSGWGNLDTGSRGEVFRSGEARPLAAD
jgi:site-specific DNA recombinase